MSSTENRRKDEKITGNEEILDSSITTLSEDFTGVTKDRRP